MNSERFKCIMTVLGRYELTLLEKQFVGRVKEYIKKTGMITEQRESILEGINREKIRCARLTARKEEVYTSKSAV